MKLALALTSTLIGLYPEPWWVLLYIPGAIAGTAGTISLATSNFGHSMMIVTAVFGTLALACSLVTMTITCFLLGGTEGGKPVRNGVLLGLSGYLAFIPYTVVFGLWIRTGCWLPWETILSAIHMGEIRLLRLCGCCIGLESD